MSKDEPRKRRVLDIVMWSALIVAIGSTLLWRALSSDEKGATIQWRCLPVEGRSIECVFESDQATDGGACFDLILDCDDGTRRAQVCSGRLEKEQPKRVELGELDPPLPDAPVCHEPRYEY